MSALTRKAIHVVFDRSQGPIVYVARTTCVALLATALLLYAAHVAGILNEPEKPDESLAWIVLTNLVAAPLIENLLLLGLIEFLSAFALRPLSITMTVATLSALVHWLAGGWRAVAGAVMFAVMTHSYFVWNDRTMGWRYRLTVVQHLLFNAPATFLWAWGIGN